MSLVDFLLHLEPHLASFFAAHGATTYGLLAGIIFAETGLVIAPFLPGDSLLFTAGALSATTALHPGVLWVLLAAAAIAGDNTNYWIGRFFGARLATSRWVSHKYLKQAHRFYEEHGPVTIVIARFIPIIRTFAPFVAGIGQMSYLTKFLPYSIAGGSLWIAIFIFGGYLFGNLPIVQAHFGLVIAAIMVLSVIPAIVEFVRSRNR